MCGITGIFHYQNRFIDKNVLRRMTDSLEHRGPDDEGYYINSTDLLMDTSKCKNSPGKGNIGFGHRRLSIIDLTTGHQPMSNEDNTIWITFNGEIYNFLNLRQELTDKGHYFKTQNSDTEVIVHAYEEWGQDCVKKLRGMFAFAIWDAKNQSLFLARDRLGIKPLYYYVDESKFLFGSELKAILQYPDIVREINFEALYDYISLGYVPVPKTIFQKMFKVSPGYTLMVHNGNISENKYWDLEFTQNTKYTEEEWCEKIFAKLQESISIRQISDVPLGAFLSGGVDSSSVVAIMSLLCKNPVKTSSIGFSEQKYNELPYAHQIVKQYKTDHYELMVNPNAIDVLEKLAWNFDEPFADSSAVPTYYVSKVARQKVTVALSGDGGDENFAGYRRYYFDRLENNIRSMFSNYFRENIIGTLAKIYPKADWLPRAFRAKTLLTNLSLDPVEGFYNSMSCFGKLKKTILETNLRENLNGYKPLQSFRAYYDSVDTLDPLSKVQYIDIKTYLLDDILTKVDRASMANSLEVRVPLLDHEFMELVATIPSKFKLKGKRSKYIFKKSMSSYVPHNILYRDKMGFSIPISRWFKNDYKEIFQDTVLSNNSCSKKYFDLKTIANLWGKHQKGLRDYSAELWSILFFEMWGRKWLN